MPDLLLELFSEEIPARMQAKAADDLRRLVTDKLVAEGLVYEGAKAFATPRRLALTVHGIPARQPDLKTERRGPKVGAPDAAVQGFLKATGLKSLDEAKIQRDPKGDFYIGLIEKPGRPAIDVLAEILPVIIRTFPWPKSMRWGARSGKPGSLNWVRPLHAITATFGIETEEPDVVKFAVDGIESGQTTYGHRFMAPDAISVRRFEDYDAKLKAAKVILDPQARKDIIFADAKELTFAQGFELVEDQVLLDEVSGLVEWPVVMMGSFEAEYLAIPDEVIRATIRNNQKCFVVKDPKTGKLTNKFVLTANIEAADGGKTIVAGNERVIRPRLSDAKFFYETDLKNWKEKSTDQLLEKFDHIVFHNEIGTERQHIDRVTHLAVEIAPFVGADVEKVRRAAQLARADRLSEVVGEFPEVQGTMGKYYALAKGEDAAIAAAIEDHYKPLGQSDRVPTDPVSIAVALADKIDMLVAFWAIDQKPSGSKDPYALKRAASGAIRILLENGIHLPLVDIFTTADIECFLDIKSARLERPRLSLVRVEREGGLSIEAVEQEWARLVDKTFADEVVKEEAKTAKKRVFSLLDFFVDRLEFQFRTIGARYDLIQAAFAIALEDDLVTIVRRVEALGKFLDSDDGKNLLAGTKRASNILSIEEKKDKRTYGGASDPTLMTDEIERHLWRTIQSTVADAKLHVASEDFETAMESLSTLRTAVDAFFEKVRVNDDDPKVRENRLKLLNEIRSATRAVADFSKIQD